MQKQNCTFLHCDCAAMIAKLLSFTLSSCEKSNSLLELKTMDFVLINNGLNNFDLSNLNGKV